MQPVLASACDEPNFPLPRNNTASILQQKLHRIHDAVRNIKLRTVRTSETLMYSSDSGKVNSVSKNI